MHDEFPDEPTMIPSDLLTPKNDIEAVKLRKKLKLKSLRPLAPIEDPAPAAVHAADTEPAPPEEASMPTPTVTKTKTKKIKTSAVASAKAAKAAKLSKSKSAKATKPAPEKAQAIPVKKAKATTSAVTPPRAKGKAAKTLKRAIVKAKAPAKTAPKTNKAKIALGRKVLAAGLAKRGHTLSEIPAKPLSARAKALLAKAAKRKAPAAEVVAPSTRISQKGAKLKHRAPGTANHSYAQTPKYKCMCCNKPSTGKFFKRGHVWAWKRAVAEILNGGGAPENHLPSWVAEAMGPWIKVKGGGRKPTVGSYEKAYRIAHAG